MRSIRTVILGVFLALSLPFAAQAQNSMPGMDMSGMNMQGMSGMHNMSATVDAIDYTTGIVDVEASGLKPRLHYPPTSLRSVKAGDKITVHLAFSKP